MSLPGRNGHAAALSRLRFTFTLSDRAPDTGCCSRQPANLLRKQSKTMPEPHRAIRDHSAPQISPRRLRTQKLKNAL